MSGGAIYQHNVAGPALIQFALFNGGLTDLGYTEDGAEFEIEMKEKEIHSDVMGGPEGPPSDLLLLGAMAKITLNMIDFNGANMAALISHRGSAYGTPETPGTLLLAGNKAVRLLINAAGNPINVLNCCVVSPNSLNLGNLVSVYKLVLRGFVQAPGQPLWNTATS